MSDLIDVAANLAETAQQATGEEGDEITAAQTAELMGRAIDMLVEGGMLPTLLLRYAGLKRTEDDLHKEIEQLEDQQTIPFLDRARSG